MRRCFRRVALVAVAAILAVVAGACRADPSGRTGTSGDITVFAAASLRVPFTRIGREFEGANPGARVSLNFGASSGLAAQINEGAPVDVFAAASPATMETVTDAGNADGAPIVFARNQLVIAVPKGNPKGIDGLGDLTGPGLKVALCAEQVPCGAAAKQALAAANVPLQPVTLERDVKAALSKLTLGEVDAAIVYRTDVRAAASDVDGIEFPESAGAINAYSIVALGQAANETGARAFIAYVRSASGQAVLTRSGFQVP